MSPDVVCPVCGRNCKNPGGLGAHLFYLKDAAHQAYRLTRPRYRFSTPEHRPRSGPEGPPMTDPPPPSTPPTDPTKTNPTPLPGVVPQDQTTGRSPPTTPTPTTPDQTNGLVSRPPELVRFTPPQVVRPLLDRPTKTSFLDGLFGTPPTKPDQTTPTTTGPARPTVEVPLEPFLAGGTAALLNAFVLNKEGDREISAQVVGHTGFPRAAEACLKLYFPDLAPDHPLVALFISGCSLALVVQSLKGPRKKTPETNTTPTQDPTKTDTTPRPDPTGRPAPTQETAPEPEDTGDAYWNSLLGQAGVRARPGVEADD